MPYPDLSTLSEPELTELIDEATRLREERIAERRRERRVGPDGAMGQDVNDPDHGAIPVPTPRAVKDKGPAHGV
ncbi:hypothetical protein M8R20_15060 [Pseudomonas sp. R2.Fl]|nr:hypothetical protein [Pseudomonas sp. R2.Fl]